MSCGIQTDFLIKLSEQYFVFAESVKPALSFKTMPSEHQYEEFGSIFFLELFLDVKYFTNIIYFLKVLTKRQHLVEF